MDGMIPLIVLLGSIGHEGNLAQPIPIDAMPFQAEEEFKVKLRLKI